MPDDPKNPDSLGDDRTFVGEGDAPAEEEQSLGDQATAGDALSSLSDLSDLADDPGDQMPLADLSERYEIQELLGKGGMGEVFRALDTRLKRTVAIKRVHGEMARSAKALSRFLTEAQSIAQLDHENIVDIYDYGRDAEGPFLIMQYIGGGSLLDRCREGALPLEEAIDLTCQVCDALQMAHSRGIIHRDIKPANILLTENGIPKLTDFGLARQESVDHGHTQEGAVLGTIDFMPPEQRRDATAVDARSDLWSLAATCYQMVTGEVPRVIDLDVVPQNLRSTFARALKQNPDDRFPTAEEFKTELRKGMGTAVSDTGGPVEADLVAGVCPTCNTANDASRKYCRGCRGLLIKPCLSCESENPVWEDVCGQCGNSQQEERDLARSRLAAMMEESLTLAREYEYEKALAQLGTVAEDSYDFTEDLREQAAEQVTLVTAERDRQYQLRDQLVELANQHHHSHDHVAVIRELKKIPVPLRSGNSIGEQLLETEAIQHELSSLLKEIRDAIKNSQFPGLLEKTTRFLELNPLQDQVLKLHEQLLQREEKSATNRRNKRLEELRTDLAAETHAAAKLPLVEEYLQLRPGDEQAKKMLQGVRQQIRVDDLQNRRREKKHKQLKKISKVARKLVVVTSAMAVFYGILIAQRWMGNSGIATVTDLILLFLFPVLCLRFLHLRLWATIFVVVVPGIAHAQLIYGNGMIMLYRPIFESLFYLLPAFYYSFHVANAKQEDVLPDKERQ